ncbi:phasin family protein [Pseudorhodoplanes sinuspersici]|nr:phasin family protein [Pseudorhodoplanes sinuspersici]
MEQARKAFDNFVTAAQQAMSDLEGRAQTARSGAIDVSGRAMTFAERNMAASFEFAQNLVRARTAEDVLRLQTEYVKAQIQALNEQTKELAEATAKVAKDTTQPRS